MQIKFRMKHIISILSAFFMVFVVVSCEPGRAENGDLLFGINGSEPTPDVVQKKLKSVTSKDDTGEIQTFTFAYTTAGLLHTVTASDHSNDFELFYDANNQINKIKLVQDDGSEVTTTNFDITYANGRFLEAKGDGSTNSGGKIKSAISAIYTNNKVTRTLLKVQGVDSADPTVLYDLYVLQNDLTWVQNNLGSWKGAILLPPYILPTIEINTVFANYDTHINPFSLLPEVYSIMSSVYNIDTYGSTGFSANNYRKITITTNAETITEDFIYVYDTDGYPVTATAGNGVSLTFQYY